MEDQAEYNTEKPPLGLKPRWQVDEERLADLDAAIDRYREFGKPVPNEWNKEMQEILLRQVKRKFSKKK